MNRQYKTAAFFLAVVLVIGLLAIVDLMSVVPAPVPLVPPFTRDAANSPIADTPFDARGKAPAASALESTLEPPAASEPVPDTEPKVEATVAPAPVVRRYGDPSPPVRRGFFGRVRRGR